MRRNTKKGFTLIELLAVIIILGVLMLIAIPSVTEYINNSRKNAFLDSGSAFISAITVKVNAAEDGFNLNDPTKAYYVTVSNNPAGSCIPLEKGGKSPFGTWDNLASEIGQSTNTVGKAYVIVVPNQAGTAYSYYFTAKDSAGYGMTPKQVGTWSKSDVVSGTAITFPATTAGTTISSAILPGLTGPTRNLDVKYVTPATNCK